MIHIGFVHVRVGEHPCKYPIVHAALLFFLSLQQSDLLPHL